MTRPLAYATVCSGIECCSVALDGMDWKPVFFAEIDPNPSAVLAYRYPHVPNLGDMTKIHFDGKEVTNGTTRIVLHGTLDLLAGGTPCTDVSTIGKRGGMAEGSGTASSLAFDYVRLVRELEPRWILWENVDGVFSSNGGRDFGSFLEALAASGYVLSWRVLSPEGVGTDKHPGGLPQRRRRVWLVGHRGDDPAIPEAVLSLGAGLPGSRDEGGAQKEEDDPGIEGGSSGAGGADGGRGVGLPAIVEADHCRIRSTARTIVGDHDSNVGDTTNLLAQAFADTFNGTITGDASPPVTARTGLPDASGPKVLAVNIHNVTISGDVAPTVTTESGGGGRSGPKVLALSTLDQRVSESAQCLSGCHASCDHVGAVWQNATIRRITPFEAERLMGLPDGYTLVPARKWRRSSEVDREHILSHCPEYTDGKFWRMKNGKLQTRLLADGPRYKACGNGWATNCARWILKRIESQLRKDERE